MIAPTAPTHRPRRYRLRWWRSFTRDWAGLAIGVGLCALAAAANAFLGR